MAGTKTLNKEQINETLGQIEQKIQYGKIDEAFVAGQKLYAAASAEPAVQMMMNNLSEIQQRINDAMTLLDNCYGKLNWEQIYNYKREIDLLSSDHKVKKVIFLKITGFIVRFNHICAEALDLIMANMWSKAEAMIKEAEIMDPGGIRSRKLRLFCDDFKEVCASNKTLDYNCQQRLRELFYRFDNYRFSKESPVFVNWKM